MDERAQDMLANWRAGEAADVSTGRADGAFVARVRQEHHRRRRPVIAIIGVTVALAACTLLAFVMFPTSARTTPASPAPIIADAEPIRDVEEWIEPSAATLATLTRLNASGDLDSLVLSRADCVAWTRTVSPLGR